MYNVDGVVSYTIEEIAGILDVTPLTVRNYIRAGIFSKNKVYGRIYIPVEELDKYMEKKGVKK